MIVQSIDIHDIEEGLDRQQLTRLKQRFLALNQQRLTRALGALSERQQQLLLLLPLLFHVNHPLFPGYVSSAAPAGIFGYKPDRDILRLAKTLARSFQLARDLTESQFHIDALFLMGSVGSVAHSEGSDLDIWVCHNPALGERALRELQRKCELISQWAAHHVHLEVHFFLMTGESFQAGKLSGLSSEASGSAQHYLLLDEFYRTALWLAGKMPLWWFVPVTREQEYSHYRDQLLRKRFVKAEEIIDFGGLPFIPPNEFIGAGIWQLYKAIESPYKSVLKLLLLEVYASALDGQQASTQNVLSQLSEPLALSFKRALYQAEPDADSLDPYIMVYARIEEYLVQRNQLARLELVRRCLYFKVNKSLSKKKLPAQKSWQRLLMESLIAHWQWTQPQLLMLDNRGLWKSPHVIAERALLVNELQQSYRLLSSLSSALDVHAAISAEELTILGRKLHAAFERKAGKIEWINPGISRDLGEAALCFIQGQEADTNWQLVRGSQRDIELRSVASEPIKRAQSLLELLLWCQVNGIAVPGTRIDILSQDFLLNQIQKQQLLQTINQWLPHNSTATSHTEFTRAAFVQRMLMIVNLGVEPQADLHRKGMQMLSGQSDPLGFGGFRENLVVSIDVVQINSWGEITCRHYERDALANALVHFLRLLPPGKTADLPELTVRCFSSGQGSNIALRLTDLWRELINCFYTSVAGATSRFILEVGEEYLLVQNAQQQPQVWRYKTYDALVEKLGQAQSEFSPIVVDAQGLRDKPLAYLSQLTRKPGIYVFYQLGQPTMLEGRSLEITVIDEKGSLTLTRVNFYDPASFVGPFVRFIRSALQQLQWDQGRHEEPLVDDVQVFELEPLRQQTVVTHNKLSSAPRGFTYAPVSLQQWPGETTMSIKAIGELDMDSNLRFTFFCDEREFSAIAYGEDIYTMVVRYILAHRRPGETYPCYITDLDLSLCRDVLAQQTGLQLSHYLTIKAELEEKLNRTLLALLSEAAQ